MAEKDYISREAAITTYKTFGHLNLHNAIESFKEIPAADVRPVVRCGECEFWNREHISCEGLARCNTGEGGIRYRNRNDFCSRGKKREES